MDRLNEKETEKNVKKVKWSTFLKDVFLCSLGSYGGPEAHYGVFSSILIEKRKYLTEEELTELIGLYAIVPGPSSTQTITAIGYYVAGPVLALLSFLVWAMPAIVTMSLIGVFFSVVASNSFWQPLITYLPAVAVAFIIYAAFSISKKVLKKWPDWILYLATLGLGLLLVPISMWAVPGLLLLGGFIYFLPRVKEKNETKVTYKPKWLILAMVIGLVIINELLRKWISAPWSTLYTSFYRYGYSVIGGGQIVIPMMIQDLVQSQSLISLNDFLSGYAIDQAVPGPLFSFAAFVASRSYSGSWFSFFAGMIGGLSIFLPGILLVFFMFPLWKSMRGINQIKHFLNGISVAAAGLIAMTAITQAIKLPVDWTVYAVVGVSVLLLLSKKIPAPLIVILAMALGFLV